MQKKQKKKGRSAPGLREAEEKKFAGMRTQAKTVSDKVKDLVSIGLQNVYSLHLEFTASLRGGKGTDKKDDEEALLDVGIQELRLEVKCSVGSVRM